MIDSFARPFQKRLDCCRKCVCSSNEYVKKSYKIHFFILVLPCSYACLLYFFLERTEYTYSVGANLSGANIQWYRIRSACFQLYPVYSEMMHTFNRACSDSYCGFGASFQQSQLQWCILLVIRTPVVQIPIAQRFQYSSLLWCIIVCAFLLVHIFVESNSTYICIGVCANS